jgi:hemerythrin-like domain-containing protein
MTDSQHDNPESQSLASRLRAAEESALYWRMRADERHQQIARMEREAAEMRAYIAQLEHDLAVMRAVAGEVVS